MPVKYYGQYIVADTEAELLTMTPQAGQIGFPMDTKLRLLYNGSSWVVNSNVTTVKGASNINALSTGNTLLYTVPSATSFRFVPLGLHTEYVSITGTLGLAPTITVGTNSTSYNNIGTSSSLLTTLSAQGTTQTSAFAAASSVTPLTASTSVYAKVSIGATLFSNYTIRIDLFGYWEV